LNQSIHKNIHDVHEIETRRNSYSTAQQSTAHQSTAYYSKAEHSTAHYQHSTSMLDTFSII
jgi:hypothetical protein